MDSNICKGNKTDFSYLIGMALQNRMQWNILALLFQNLAPTLNETREIISILLKELESLQSILQKKEKLSENHQRGSDNVEGTKLSKVQNSVTSEEMETVLDDFKIDNDIELLLLKKVLMMKCLMKDKHFQMEVKMMLP